jgi:CheY-like chemotaxis protein
VRNRSLVSVVDDDESVRESLPDMLRQFGFAARAFSSAEAFLESNVVSETSCLLLDVAMPGMSGPELQQELKRRRQEIPIVFVTAHSDEVGTTGPSNFQPNHRAAVHLQPASAEANITGLFEAEPEIRLTHTGRAWLLVPLSNRRAQDVLRSVTRRR